MVTNAILRSLCYTEAEARAALPRLEQSDLIFCDDNGLRLVCRSAHIQVYLQDRYPHESEFASVPLADDTPDTLLRAGYSLVRLRPFRFSPEQIMSVVSRPGQVVAPAIKATYSTPLIPLLKIRNLRLEERVYLALRTIVAKP